MAMRHISTSIEGLLLLSDGQLKKMLSCITDDNGRCCQTVKQLREALGKELESGKKYLPATGCDNYGEDGMCLGHER